MYSVSEYSETYHLSNTGGDDVREFKMVVLNVCLHLREQTITKLMIGGPLDNAFCLPYFNDPHHHPHDNLPNPFFNFVEEGERISNVSRSSSDLKMKSL